jgi:hypothetical protein
VLSLQTSPAPPAALGRRRRLVLLGVVLLTGLALRLPTFARPLISDDESIYAVTADAMRRGDVLYRDVVDHKPPAIYDVYLLGYRLLGPYDTRGAHALVVLAVLVAAIAVARAGARLAGDDRTGLLAALLWVVFSTTMLDYDSLAANCELFLVAAQAIAFAWLVARDPGRPRQWGAWLGVGILGGLSTAFKYQGATFAAVIAAAVLLEWRDRRRSPAGALAALAVAGLGFLVVPAFYVVRLWQADGLASARYWFLFNFSYVSEGPKGWGAVTRAAWRTLLVGGIGAFLPYSFGLAGAWQTVRARLETAADRAARGATEARLLAVVWLAASAIALAAGARFFGHYYHHVLPALCLLAGLPLMAAWRSSRWVRPAVVALMVVPAAVGLLASTVYRPQVIAATDPEPDYAPVVRELDRLSRPDDRVFVWGNSPQVYVLAQRPMGTRFSFCNYHTGISPGTRTESGEDAADANELMAAWPMLFRDLDERRPRWFVDAAAAGWDGYTAFQVRRYPSLQRYLDSHYVIRERVDGVGIYERSTP